MAVTHQHTPNNASRKPTISVPRVFSHAIIATMNESASELAEDETALRWSPLLRARDVFILGSVSILLFLWTRHPALGAVLPLLLSGRKCWNVGWWLFDRDPDRRRAVTVLMFYIALAGWHAGAAALGTVVGCIVLKDSGWLEIPETRIMWTFVVLFLALAWNGFLCSIGLMRALRHHQKVWLSPSLIEQCEQDFSQLADLEWNPKYLNRAVFVIAAGVGFPLLIAFSVILAVLSWTLDVSKNESIAFTLFLLVMAAMFIIPIIMVAVLVHHIAASSPSQCWRNFTTTSPLPN
jgi:hypothetical protein